MRTLSDIPTRNRVRVKPRYKNTQDDNEMIVFVVLLSSLKRPFDRPCEAQRHEPVGLSDSCIAIIIENGIIFYRSLLFFV